jgi:hypothetical protein
MQATNEQPKISSLLSRFSEPETLKMAKLGRELRAQGIDVIDLSLGEPDFDTPEHIKEAAKKAIDDNWSHYTPVAGYLDLREAVCTKLKRDNNLDYKPEQIVVSTGAKQSLANIILALVDAGDEVIIPAPFWVTYSELVKIAGGGAVLNGASDIGASNIAFTRHYLQTEKLQLQGEHVGGDLPRKVCFHPQTGQAQVKSLVTTRNDTVAARERLYVEILGKAVASGGVELFRELAAAQEAVREALAAAGGASRGPAGHSVELSFEEVEMEGYGPFREHQASWGQSRMHACMAHRALPHPCKDVYAC